MKKALPDIMAERTRSLPESVCIYVKILWINCNGILQQIQKWEEEQRYILQKCKVRAESVREAAALSFYNKPVSLEHFSNTL